MKNPRFTCSILALALPIAGMHAQGPPEDAAAQKLREEMRQLRSSTEAAIKELDSRLVDTLRQDSTLPTGRSGFLLTGYASAGFTDSREETGSFGAGFNPVFLWKVDDHLFFEAELELELEDRDTEVELEYAQLTYAVSDNLTVGAGKFLVPFGQFGERLHPAWINKLPDAPLHWGHHGGIAPMAEIGIQVRGAAVMTDNSRINWAAYVSNGPHLVTTGAEAGELEFGSAEENNTNHAYGGRIGILHMPGFEVGFSFMNGRAGANDDPTAGVDALLYAFDASWTRHFDALKGTVDTRFEWMRSDVDAHPSLVSGQANERDGWYAQFAYRPDKVESSIKNWEIVGRYDTLEVPSSLNEDRRRITVGLNYWLGASSVAKVAYQFDDRNGPGDDNIFMLQFALGF